MNISYALLVIEEQRRAARTNATHARLVRQAKQVRPRRAGMTDAAILWMGGRLVAWGRRLEARSTRFERENVLFEHSNAICKG